MTARDLRLFMKEIPNEAEVVFSEGIITFMFGDNTLALNKCGGQWDNGVGYAPGGTVCCGECSHFDCTKCGNTILKAIEVRYVTKNTQEYTENKEIS